MQRSLTVASMEDLAQNGQGHGHGYIEWAPVAALADRVACVWVDPAREHRAPVLPDACIDLVWDGRALHVAGPDTRAVPLVDSSTTFVGVRFRPGAAPGFLGLPASELVDARVELRDIWGSSADPLAEALEARPASGTDLLQQALLERHASAGAPDPLVRGLLSALALPLGSANTPVSVGALADSLGVSHRTLRRRCTEALGYGSQDARTHLAISSSSAVAAGEPAASAGGAPGGVRRPVAPHQREPSAREYHPRGAGAQAARAGDQHQRVGLTDARRHRFCSAAGMYDQSATDSRIERGVQLASGQSSTLERRGGGADELRNVLAVHRAAGRPHVTPLPAVWLDDALHLCVGSYEQKAKNLEHDAHCVLTTGTNRLRSGLDVVIEGEARRVRERAQLERLAALWNSKLDWPFEVGDDGFRDGGGRTGPAFRVDATKVLAFGKGKAFTETRYRLAR